MGKCASRDKSASSSRTPRFLFKKGAERQQRPAVNPVNPEIPDHPKPSSSKREEKVVEEGKAVEASEAATGLVPVLESKPEAEPVVPAPPPPPAPSPPPPARSLPPPAPSPPPPPSPAPSDDTDIDTTVTSFDEQDAINADSGRITLLPGDESGSASSSAYNTAHPSPARSFASSFARSPDSVYLSGSEDMPSYRASPVPKLVQAGYTSCTDEDPFLARAGVGKQGGAALAGSSGAGFSGQRARDEHAGGSSEGAGALVKERASSPPQGEENWEMVSPKGLGPGEWVSVPKPEGQGGKELAAAPPVLDEGAPKLAPVAAAAGSKSKTSPEDEEADTVKSLGSDQSDEIETRSLTGDGGDYVLLGATEKGEKAGNAVDAAAAASEPTSSVAAGAMGARVTEVEPESKPATPSDSQVVAKPVQAAPAPSIESQAPVVEQRSLPAEAAPVEVAAPVVEVPGTQIEEKAELPVKEEKASSAPSVEEVPTSTEKDKDDAPVAAAPAEGIHTPAMKELAAAQDEAQDSPLPEGSIKASAAEEKAAVTPAPVIVEEVDPAPRTEELEATPTSPAVEDKVAEEESTPEAAKVPLLASKTASKTAPEPTSEPAPEPTSEPAPEPTSEPAPEPASAPVSRPASETVPGPAPEAPVMETKPSSDDSSWRAFKEEIQSESGAPPREAAPTA